jgi:hypothetical protein
MARLRVSLYADNAAVFINSVKEDVDMVMQIMHSFGEATGLCINVNKSTVAPISCSHINLDEVLQNFAGAQVQFSINYLGLPVSLGRLCMVHLQPILDRAAQRLSGWQGRLMNMVGGKNWSSLFSACCPHIYLQKLSHRENSIVQWTSRGRDSCGRVTKTCREVSARSIGIVPVGHCSMEVWASPI